MGKRRNHAINRFSTKFTVFHVEMSTKQDVRNASFRSTAALIEHIATLTTWNKPTNRSLLLLLCFVLLLLLQDDKLFLATDLLLLTKAKTHKNLTTLEEITRTITVNLEVSTAIWIKKLTTSALNLGTKSIISTHKVIDRDQDVPSTVVQPSLDKVHQGDVKVGKFCVCQTKTHELSPLPNEI